MGEHLALYVDRLAHPPNAQAPEDAKTPMPMAAVDSSEAALSSTVVGNRMNEQETFGEGEPLIRTVECRICQEEDLVHNFEVPCACRGSLKYAHRNCVQLWCNEKGDITCEICHQAYQPGYTAPPPPPPHLEDATIDIGGWTITGSPLDLHDPRLLAIAEAENQLLEAEYDDYAASSASGASLCRSSALVLMVLLLIRHALAVSDGNDTSAFFSLFLLRAAGFLLPCYIMAWAISILQQRRQRQEAEALAATQVAFVLQSGEHRGLHFTIAPHLPAATPQEIA